MSQTPNYPQINSTRAGFSSHSTSRRPRARRDPLPQYSPYDNMRRNITVNDRMQSDRSYTQVEGFLRSRFRNVSDTEISAAARAGVAHAFQILENRNGLWRAPLGSRPVSSTPASSDGNTVAEGFLRRKSPILLLRLTALYSYIYVGPWVLLFHYSQQLYRFNCRSH